MTAATEAAVSRTQRPGLKYAFSIFKIKTTRLNLEVVETAIRARV